MLKTAFTKQRRLFLLPIILATLTMGACGTPVAQTQFNDVPVLVLVDDQDPNSVKRSSYIVKQVIRNLKVNMKRLGFRMVDEEAVAADLGWKIKDRRNKQELLDLTKWMNKSEKANTRVRTAVIFEFRAGANHLSHMTKIDARITGEIIDIVGNDLIDIGTLYTDQFPGPVGCNAMCLENTVADRARDIAGSLGAVLGKQLADYIAKSTDGSRSAGPAIGGTPRTGHGLLTPYDVTLRHFDTREALSIIGVMADEFPGYKEHNLIRKLPILRKYRYITSAKPNKIEKWLSILLMDMGFDVDKQVEIDVQGSEIRVEKIVTTPNRPRSVDEKTRFK